jgi:hypothetical protein
VPRLLNFAPGGVGQYFDEPGWQGKPREVHASTCAHCTHITEFPSRKVMTDHVEICRGCMKLICLRCAGQPCRPAEAEADRVEREARLGRKIEMQGWRCY